MTNDSIGIVGPDTPVGSILVMEGIDNVPGEQYTLTGHHEALDDAPPCFTLASIDDTQTELEGQHSYESWAQEYAGFVEEIKFPPTPVDATQEPELGVGDCAVLPEGEILSLQSGNPISFPSSAVTAVEDARADFKEAESEYLSLKEQAAAAKKHMEEAQDALNNAVDEMLDGEATRPDGWPVDAPLAVAAESQSPSPAESGDWEQVDLADLKDPHIKVGILKVLSENDPPLRTLGDLSKVQKADGEFWAKNIKGIGKAALDNIAAATDAFWARKTEKLVN